MAHLSLSNLRKSFGRVDVIHGVDLEVPSGEFLVFVGPSGCGKSTLLRMIAGLEEISHGEMRIDGELVNALAPAKRGVAMVFQSYALYPHMTVYKNMAFGLKLAHASAEETRDRVMRAADMLQLTDLLERLPKQLSGGQRQRVAIGRAITRDPKLFLFDEPLSNLDASLRVATRIEISRLKQQMPKTTMIYVTHDQVEAMTLADRIVVLNAGRIEQVGSPMELYHHPQNTFVAGFIGSPAMNLVNATFCSERRILTTEAGLQLPLPQDGGEIGPRVSRVGFRPEDILRTDDAKPDLSGRVTLVEKLGDVTLAYIDHGEAAPIVVKAAEETPFKTGETAHFRLKRDRLHFFDADGHRLS